VVDIVDVVKIDVGPEELEDVEVEPVVVDGIGFGISLSKTAAEYGGNVTWVVAR
jgi:hypothetical protein